MSAGIPNTPLENLISSLTRLSHFNAAYADKDALIPIRMLDHAIKELERLRTLDMALDKFFVKSKQPMQAIRDWAKSDPDNWTDEECEKLYKGLMEGEIHSGEN